jgi:hypothetical protein
VPLVTPGDEVLRATGTFHRFAVHRHGRVVVKETGPWAPTVLALLRHLEDVGFAWSPRLAESGADDPAGRQVIRYHYVDGDISDHGPWSLDAVAAIGRIVRAVHDATASFRPPPGALWKPWLGRDLGASGRVIGHCDVAPWNLVQRDGRPVALIDWEVAGPVDPRVDLAYACWLNVKLHDDQVAAGQGLPPLDERARQMRAMLDAYGLSARQRRGFVDLMVELAVHITAETADEAGIAMGNTHTIDPMVMWSMAWQARSAAWMLRHRPTLERALA